MRQSFLTKTVASSVILAFSSLAFADISGDGRIAFVPYAPTTFEQIENNLLQSVTGQKSACGPTALLFVSNHHRFIREGINSPNMSSIDASKRTLSEMYAFLRKPNNTITSLDELNKIAKDKFGWQNTKRFWYGNGVSKNIDNLWHTLGMDYPAIAVISANAPDYPLPESSTRVDHFVIIYEYSKETDEYGRYWKDPSNTRNMDTITYYEPYYGRIKTVLRKDIARSFNMTGFAYLQVGK